MEIYISADIEGIAGIVNWDETSKWKPDYLPFREEMTKEVQAACEGANNAGAKEFWIKDARGTGRNLDFNGLPSNTKLIRGFSGHPFLMMQELDQSFDAVLMLGYHSCAGSDESPLAHTLKTSIRYIKINGEYASEFLINAYTAALVGVPVVFVSGDIGLCNYIKEFNPNIRTVGVNKGEGDSVISPHPHVVYKDIKTGVQEALRGDMQDCRLALPKRFEIELSFVEHAKAYKGSFYPNMKKISSRELFFETNDYFEVLRILSFVV
ncbi:MAG: M55 family metallopeptidase [Clostridia bacterium]